ncbi:MAG: hypothetical protein A2X35_02965 [Elusimicrobia bacterium GWA2_61_42]|nr:MAG: hypothetical protein A2X35_02965 [Elusimicrobia bacterium GWA2_61_42]OGR74798.1 MAG: hypothetical protein A2X38_08530 [Elusimicrobia bacterium GWC2_61_25]
MKKNARKALERLLWGLPLVSLLATLWLVYTLRTGDMKLAAHRFETEIGRVNQSVSIQLLTVDDMLHACAGLFRASDTVSRREWRLFVELLDTTEYSPAIQTIGFVKRVPAAQKNRHISEARAGGFPGYELKPAARRAEYFPVLYQEPLRTRGRRLAGYDMASEPELLAAMEKARDSGQPEGSSPVLLTPPGEEEPLEPGFIVFRAVYAKGKNTLTLAQRREALDGFVYVSVRSAAVAAYAMSLSEPGVVLRLFDVSGGASPRLIYDSAPGGKPGKGLAKEVASSRYGCSWRQEFYTLPAFTQRYRMGHALALLSGLLVSLLLLWLASAQSERGRALDLVESASQALQLTQFTIDHSGAPLFLVNPDATFYYVNRAACDLLGYTFKEMMAQTAITVNPQYIGAEGWVANWEKVKKQKQIVYEAELKNKDGGGVPVEITANYVSHGEKELKCVFIHDLTARRRNEQEMRKLFLAIESGPASVIITDVTGRIEYVNPKFTEITGYSREEALGKNPRILKSGEKTAEFYREMWNTLLAGQPWHGECHNKKKDGSLYWEMTHISSVRGAKGELTHFVAVKEDISDRKRMELELKRAKDAAESANRTKSVFLSSMSHEIRTPLNAILGFSQLLRRDPDLTPKQTQQIETINRSGRHLLALINDILEMSKIKAGRATLNLSSFDLGGLLEDLGVMFRQRVEGKGLELVVERSAGLPPFVRGDEGKLMQILVNLLGNALKFTTLGRITLRAAGGDGAGPRLVVEVEDSGVGMEAAELSRLFSPFEQAKAGQASGTGTGLGLAISREYARLMGGDITVTSRAGKGTVFRLDIPVKEASSAAAAVKETVRQVKRLAPGQPVYRVLIADDKPDNRDFLDQLLGFVGFEVRQAVDGAEALRAFGEWRPHLILMDIKMPVMDGYEATMRVRSSPGGKDVKIIVLSASAIGDVRQEAIANGADDYLAKPFREGELFEKLRRTLGAEFVYEEEPRGTAEKAEEKVTGAALASLPAELAGRVREAAVSGDFDRLSELAAEAGGPAPEAAAALKALAARFDAKAILGLLPKADADGK